jgi:hypothetical protein
VQKKDKKLISKKFNAEIKIDMKIFISVEKNEELKGIRNTLSLSSAVEEVSDSGTLLVHMPSYQGYPYPLPRNES